MTDRPRYITAEGFARIRAEYEELFSVERPKLVETISWAAANGDRSENADYQYGRRRLREVDRLGHPAEFVTAADFGRHSQVAVAKRAQRTGDTGELATGEAGDGDGDQQRQNQSCH